MRNVNLKLSGFNFIGKIIVRIDDKIVPFKTNKFGNLVYNYQTSKDTTSIKIYNIIDSGGIIWFITQLIFFLISIFGIFDSHKKESCLRINYGLDVKLEENNEIFIRYNSASIDKVIEVETNLETTEYGNEFILDKKAKNIRKVLLIAKILLLLIGIAAIALIVFKIITEGI